VSTTSLAAQATLQNAADPTSAITAALSAFFNDITGNGTLSSQWAQVKSGAQSMTDTSSAAGFIQQGLGELLRIIALLVDGVLAVGNGLVSALFSVIDDLIQLMFGTTTGSSPQPGLLTSTLEIPVLTWLYNTLFGQPLTILNALTLVISIPVTLIWRIVEGQWPADSGFATPARGARIGAEPVDTQRFLAYVNLIVSIILGVVNAVGDAAGSESAPLIFGKAALLLSVGSAAITTPNISSDSPGELAWAAWGVGLSQGLLNVLSSIDFGEAGNALNLGGLGAGLLSALSMAQLLVQGLQWDPTYGVVPTNPLADAALGIDMVTALPGVINPIKMVGEIPPLVVAALDVIMGVAAGVAGVLSAYAPT
jgi:hypothetical protein